MGDRGSMTIFRFDYSFTRTPLKMRDVIPYVHPPTRQRMLEALERGCDCHHDDQRTASLTQRNGAAWLQCDACGSSLGSAMKRDHHPKYPSYIRWRQDLADRYRLEWDTWRESKREETLAEIDARQDAFKQLAAQRAEAYRQKKIEYADWLRRSPEWAQMRERIFWRCRGRCEACISGNAFAVHHLTYRYGKLPPAWELRAVCQECHERLHESSDEWCDWGMAR